MGQKSSARPPDGKILKKEVLGYAGICLVLLLLLGAGGMLSRTFPVRALVNALIHLLVGGLGMSVWISCFRPGVERSEFFRTFRWLYHPGIWMLAAASFLEGSDILSEPIAGNLHLAYIAGWTFLVAGAIVLAVILREGKT